MITYGTEVVDPHMSHSSITMHGVQTVCQQTVVTHDLVSRHTGHSMIINIFIYKL